MTFSQQIIRLHWGASQGGIDKVKEGHVISAGFLASSWPAPWCVRLIDRGPSQSVPRPPQYRLLVVLERWGAGRNRNLSPSIAIAHWITLWCAKTLQDNLENAAISSFQISNKLILPDELLSSDSSSTLIISDNSMSSFEKRDFIFSTSDISYQMCYCCQKFSIFNGIGLKCTDRPQMYSCLIGSDRSQPIRQLYIWGRFRTFEADSVHLRPICTFEAEIIYFVMWCLSANQSTESASNVRNQPQMYGISLKCTDWPQMYIHLRPIPYIWGQSDSTGRGRPILRPVMLISRPIALPCPGEVRQWPGRVQLASNVWNRPQMYVRKSASNVQISLKCTAVYLSIYLSISFAKIGLKCTDFSKADR